MGKINTLTLEIESQDFIEGVMRFEKEHLTNELEIEKIKLESMLFSIELMRINAELYGIVSPSKDIHDKLIRTVSSGDSHLGRLESNIRSAIDKIKDLQ